MSLPQPRSLYLDVGTHQVFARFHPAAAAAGRPALGVVLAPQFGWEAMCSARPRRAGAQQLAAAGIAVVRIDHAASGDSSGTADDSGLLDAWIAGVDVAARWLRGDAGCERVAVIGLELGGMAALCAATSGTPVDDLILWNVPASGRTLLRGLRAFARFELSPPPPRDLDASVPDDTLVAGGYAIRPGTFADLAALDLTTRLGSLRPGQRVLLLGRDDLDPDATLQAALRDAGAALDTAPGPGYSAMTAEPTVTEPPTAAIAEITTWLHAGAAPAVVAAAPSVGAATTLALTVGDRGIREMPLAIEQPFGTLFGILAEPDGEPAPLCVVLLNAGALTHTGPNRMWVEAARRWAGAGVPSLRLDLEGIGEADGDASAYADVGAFYTEAMIPQVRSALDALVARGLPPRFVLLGLCSGAYWALHTALQDERVSAAYLINPRALLWDDQFHALQQVRKLRKLARPETWRKLRRGQPTTHPSVIARAAVELTLARARPGAAAIPTRPAFGALFDALEATGARAEILFTGDEPLYDELRRGGELARLERWPSITLTAVADTAQTHTLRPLWCQEHVHKLLDAALARDLAG